MSSISENRLRVLLNQDFVLLKKEKWPERFSSVEVHVLVLKSRLSRQMLSKLILPLKPKIRGMESDLTLKKTKSSWQQLKFKSKQTDPPISIVC